MYYFFVVKIINFQGFEIESFENGHKLKNSSNKVLKKIIVFHFDFDSLVSFLCSSNKQGSPLLFSNYNPIYSPEIKSYR